MVGGEYIAKMMMEYMTRQFVDSFNSNRMSQSCLEMRTIWFNGGRQQGNSTALQLMLRSSDFRRWFYPRVLVVCPNVMMIDRHKASCDNRVDLVTSAKTPEYFKGLRESYDLVVFDTCFTMSQSDVYKWLCDRELNPKTVLVT